MTSIPTHSTASAAPLMAPTEGSRRAEIALVAAEEFTRRGYHSTRVEHIADRLSVTPGALYRHVPGKYEMFRDAVATLATALESASLRTSEVNSSPNEPVSSDSTGRPTPLEEMVASITRTTLRHRSRAALYRWQSRYLTPGDYATALEVDARVRHRLADAVRGRQREDRGHTSGASSAAAAILSCIASLGHHRIEVSDADAVALMTSIAETLAISEPPPRPGPDSAGPSIRTAPFVSPRLRGGAATREGAIEAAIARFHSSGYDSVTMESIGADVGVAASALYRHFPGKSALLTAAVDRTATLVESLLDGHAAMHGAGTDPADALADLLEAYVSIAFSHGPELTLYHSELGSIDAADRRRLRGAQRRQLDRWAELVREWDASAPGNPDGPPRAPIGDAVARIRVHAALTVVLDGGQGTGFHPAVAPRFGQLAGLVLMPRQHAHVPISNCRHL